MIRWKNISWIQIGKCGIAKMMWLERVNLCEWEMSKRMENKEKSEKRKRKKEKELNLDLVVLGLQKSCSRYSDQQELCRWYSELQELRRRYSKLQESCRRYSKLQELCRRYSELQELRWWYSELQELCGQYSAYDGRVVAGTRATMINCGPYDQSWMCLVLGLWRLIVATDGYGLWKLCGTEPTVWAIDGTVSSRYYFQGVPTSTREIVQRGK